VFDVSVLRLLLLVVTGWLDRREREALAYLVEEHRVLRRQLGGRRVQLTMTNADDLPHVHIGSAVWTYASWRRS
jgi:hypothetical protein